VLRELEQRVTDFRIAAETLGSADEPQVQVVFGHAEIRQQLRVVALGIIYEISRMDLEELRQ
jgi:hypothetical protein